MGSGRAASFKTGRLTEDEIRRMEVGTVGFGFELLAGLVQVNAQALLAEDSWAAISDQRTGHPVDIGLLPLVAANDLAAVATKTYQSDMWDVSSWLVENGFDRFVDLFVNNEIDGAVLRDLTDEHLKELGIPLGSRLKLLKAIARLREAESETRLVQPPLSRRRRPPPRSADS